MEIKLAKLKLKNPVILASGTFDKTITQKIDIEKLGAIATKTITLYPRPGNPLPHIIKTKYGWINSVGLKNPGLQKYLSQDLPFWKKFNIFIITSIAGETEKEYLELANKLENANIPAIEANVSCPNIKKGSISFGTEVKILQSLIKKIRQKFSGTLIVKLTPNVFDICKIADAALSGGADILTVANTYLALEIDNQKRKPKLAKIIGGYSGPAIKPLTLRVVWQIYKKFHCPIIASGGIENFSDALDYIMCGATAITIGSINYLNPEASIKIVRGFQNYFKKHQIKNINQIRGLI